jgi:hypothetical protein
MSISLPEDNTAGHLQQGQVDYQGLCTDQCQKVFSKRRVFRYVNNIASKMLSSGPFSKIQSRTEPIFIIFCSLYVPGKAANLQST